MGLLDSDKKAEHQAFSQVRSARRLLQKPSVVEGELEPGVCVWCYCCQEEVKKHVTDRQVSIKWGGLLEHMARYVAP